MTRKPIPDTRMERLRQAWRGVYPVAYQRQLDKARQLMDAARRILDKLGEPPMMA